MSDSPAPDDLGGFRRLPPAADTGGFTRTQAAAVTHPTTAADSLWKSLLGFGRDVIRSPIAAPFQSARGVVEGVMGEGPKGKASELPGGVPQYLGRGVGRGVGAVAEGLWESLIKPAGEALTGEITLTGVPEAARGMAMGLAGAGGFRPGMTLPRHQVPAHLASPPQLLLPPPTMGVAGQPATATGVGPREFDNVMTGLLEGGAPDRTLRSARERLPQPGMMPPGPAGTMTRPEATPPPTSPRAAAGLEPEPPPIRPPEPVVEAAVRNPRADAMTTSKYRKAVQPSTVGQRNATQLARQDSEILTGVDNLIENQPNFKLTDAKGAELPAGTAPRSMWNFFQGISQSKTALFEKWDALTRRAGDEGLMIDLTPIASELRALATKPENRLVKLDAAQTFGRYAEALEAQRFLTPLETQNVIKSLNQELSGFYGAHKEASTVSARVLAPIAEMLRRQLDEGIANAAGPGWQRFRNEYGALSAIEADVARAVQRIANKPNSGLQGLGDLIGNMEFVTGVLMANPHAVARSVGAKGAAALHRFINDPNRTIQRMFDRRIAARAPPAPPSAAWGALPPAYRGGAVWAGDEHGDLSGLAGIGAGRRASQHDITPPPGPR